MMRRGSFLHELSGLRFAETTAESMALNNRDDMCVIIAGSGMCDGGRIVHHLRHNLWKPNVAVLIVGFQTQGSLGRRLVDGAKDVRIFGEKVVVRAAVHLLGGFSAHAGQSELVEWAGHLAPSRPRFVLTHGEPKACEALRISLRTRLGIDAECPEPAPPFRSSDRRRNPLHWAIVFPSRSETDVEKHLHGGIEMTDRSRHAREK